MKVSAADKGMGKSKSITIKNEKGHLLDEEIEHMVAEAEEFAAEDEAIRNSLSNFNYGVKSQLADQEGLMTSFRGFSLFACIIGLILPIICNSSMEKLDN